MWGKLFKIDRIVRPEATQYTCQKYISTDSQPAEGHTTKKCYKPYTYTYILHTFKT